ncbi:minor tail protein [Microbacterium phage Typher]|nr:minor tail protein [Microbacterium phage Typher]
MAENSWPFYGAETNETQFSKWARTLADNGIASGLAITAGAGMSVTLGIGNGLVRGLFYENTTALNKAVTAAPSTSGQTRKDYLILKLDQNANAITFVVKAGTANASGGTLPTLQQDETIFEFPIGILSVAYGVAAITNAMITELRPGIGNRVLVNTEARKPAASTASGALFFNTTTKQIEYSDGASWSSLITVDILTGILPLGKGGTGLTTYKALREALDINVQPTAPAHKKGRVWIPGPALD